MGQAKRRKEKLGNAYGTPEGSNRPLIVFKGSDQTELDKLALSRIQQAKSVGDSVTLIGTEAARPLALAAGLPWLHELPANAPVPKQVAWDPMLAIAGGPVLPKRHREDCGLLVLGAGSTAYLEKALTIS